MKKHVKRKLQKSMGKGKLKKRGILKRLIGGNDHSGAEMDDKEVESDVKSDAFIMDEDNWSEEENRNETKEHGKMRRRRGRSKGKTLAIEMMKQKESRSEKQFKPWEVLCMAQVWIAVSQRRVMTEENMWKEIENVCVERFQMTISANSLRAKCSTLQRDACVLITAKAAPNLNEVPEIGVARED